jgi:hypothetical protein
MPTAQMAMRGIGYANGCVTSITSRERVVKRFDTVSSRVQASAASLYSEAIFLKLSPYDHARCRTDFDTRPGTYAILREG